MHELSIAQSLIDVAAEKLADYPTARVVSLTVRVGELSGVIPEALRSAFEIAQQHTRLDGARLIIEECGITLWCEKCNAVQPARGLASFRCVVCDSPGTELRGGKELDLMSMELEAE